MHVSREPLRKSTPAPLQPSAHTAVHAIGRRGIKPADNSGVAPEPIQNVASIHTPSHRVMMPPPSGIPPSCHSPSLTLSEDMSTTTATTSTSRARATGWLGPATSSSAFHFPPGLISVPQVPCLAKPCGAALTSVCADRMLICACNSDALPDLGLQVRARRLYRRVQVCRREQRRAITMPSQHQGMAFIQR